MSNDPGAKAPTTEVAGQSAAAPASAAPAAGPLEHPPAPRPPAPRRLRADRGWLAFTLNLVLTLVFAGVVACIQNRGLVNVTKMTQDKAAELADQQDERDRRLARIELRSRARSLACQVQIAQSAYTKNASAEFVHGNTDGLRAVVFGFEKGPDRRSDVRVDEKAKVETTTGGDAADGPHVFGFGSSRFERHTLSMVAQLATDEGAPDDLVTSADQIEASVVVLAYNLAGGTWKCKPGEISECKRIADALAALNTSAEAFAAKVSKFGDKVDCSTPAGPQETGAPPQPLRPK
jgi:hypothetical protein